MLLKQNNQFKELEIDNVTNLSYLGLIKVTGADAQQFLQGQFTNDITQVDATHHQLSAWCNHKGRIIVSLRIFQRNGYFYLLLPQESITSVLKRLKMYVLRSVVKLDDVSNDLIRIGISGTYSKKIVTDCLFTPPPEIDTSVTENATTVLQIAGTVPRYIIISETMPTCLPSVSENPKVWQLLDILAGLPMIGLATTEEFIPQMVSYQQVNGISFNKGCYSGQEVVARVHYLGKLKRKLYLAKIDTSDVPKPGDDVQTDGENVGKIVNVVQHSEGSFVVLASVKHTEFDKVYWQMSLLQFLIL